MLAAIEPSSSTGRDAKDMALMKQNDDRGYSESHRVLLLDGSVELQNVINQTKDWNGNGQGVRYHHGDRNRTVVTRRDANYDNMLHEDLKPELKFDFANRVGP